MHSDTQDHTDTTASSSPRKPVFVTGAGFTRALVESAPLLVDDFGNNALAERVHGLPNASRLLEQEFKRNEQGHIDIERLMTRVESLMPYDYAGFADNAANEYALLLSELKRSFLDCIRKAREGEVHHEELNKFAQYCVNEQYDCITFNYDDFLDQALSRTSCWHPLGGYGFYCPDSINTISQKDEGIPKSKIALLKLHGSVNWRSRLGHAVPPPLNAITHHDDWSGIPSTRVPPIEAHLDAQPVMIPPVLSKSSLMEQPVLRLVWSRAFEALQSAPKVTFLGYSFPTTDIAARTLFSESLTKLRCQDIHIVNLASTETEKQKVRTAYRSALGDIPDTQFQFAGALDWIRELPSSAPTVRN